MSVDLVGPDLENRNRLFPAGPARHTFVFYGGLISRSDRGGPITERRGDGSGKRSAFVAYEEIAKLFPHESYRVGFDPTLDGTANNQSVRDGGDFITGLDARQSPARARFHPSGRLIVTGYSAGGVNAIRLCERLQQYFEWYDFADRQLGCGPTPPPRADNTRWAKLMVDLLVTIDPCVQLLRQTFELRKPANVRRHVNYYQTAPMPAGRSETDWFTGTSIPTADINAQWPPPRPPYGEHDPHQLIVSAKLVDVQGEVNRCLASRAAAH